MTLIYELLARYSEGVPAYQKWTF